MSLPIIQTIQNNINSLKSTKTDIKNAVNTDYDFIANEQIENYPSLIKQGIAYYKNRVPHATKEGTDLSFNATPLKFENMTIKGNTEQTTSILPDTYTQVDYIESAGAGYIDTEVNADSNLSFEMDYEFTDISNQEKIYLGAIYNPSGTSYTRFHSAISTSNNLGFILRGTGTDVGTIDTNRHKWFISQEKFIFDGTEILPVDIQTFDTTINFWLMGRNSNNDSLKKYTYIKLYRCKMWYSNTLVRDFIPCYRNSDDELGLYDTVNDVFYPKQGTGTFSYGAVAAIPNPDYPQDIHVVTGNNTIGVTGKNLFNKDSTVEGILSEDGTISSGSQYVTSDYIEIDSSKTYTKTATNSARVKFYDANKTVISTSSYSDISNFGPQQSFSAPYVNARYIRYCVNKSILSTQQLEEGSNATDYEPYVTPRTYPLNLGNIELCKIGNYQDYLYKENGNWYKYGAVGKFILNGSESSWAKSSRTEIDRFTISTSDYINDANSKCNYFTRSPLSDYSAGKFCNNAGVQLVFNFTEYGTTTLGQWKTWLSTHNLVLYQPLKESTSTQITDTTLISQLDAIDKAKGNNGTTIITSTGTDLAPILNFTAYLKEVE